MAWAQSNDILGRVRSEQIPDSASAVDSVLDAFDRSYSYDKAGRLSTVKDRTATSGHLSDSGTAGIADGGCQTRIYAFDRNGNRTSLATYPAAADGTCQNATGATTKTWAVDSADRLTTGSGYGYDTFGRATTIPAAESPSGAALTLGYFDTDAARTITSGSGSTGTTTTYSLDPGGRRLQGTTTPASGGTATSTVVRHYTDPSDNPGWIADTTAGTSTRYGEGLAGDLATEIVTTGSTTTAALLALADLHGDVTATATIPASANAAGIDTWSDTTEYGTPRTGTTTPATPAATTGSAANNAPPTPPASS